MLSPLSSIYAFFTKIRNDRFDSGKTAITDLGARTISVGNITTGGTGKTPLVIHIAQKLASRGRRVAILTRGYGRADPKKRILVADGKEILADARTGGDEPVEMARSLGGKAIIVADPDRVAAGTWAREKYGVTSFVLDDGFQHRRAKRDLDIICIDGTDPFGGGKLLPSGRLREPLANLKRADAIVITRADLAADIAGIRSEIAKYNSKCSVFTASVRMSQMTMLPKFLEFAGGVTGDAPEISFVGLANASAFAFCGLGRPAAFFDQLKKDNYPVAASHAFPDHHVYSPTDIAMLIAKAKQNYAGYLLTTAKDAVKLGGLEIALPCLVLETEMVLDDDAAFSALL